MEPDIPKETRRERQKQETRALILDAARQLFSASGFEKTTIKAIAQAACVGFGTVFNHFPDKSSLLIATLLDDLVATQSKAMKSLPEHAPFQEKFLHLSKHFYMYYSNNVSLSRTLIKEMLFVEGPWGQILKDSLMEYLSLIVEYINEGKARGEVDVRVDSAILAQCMFSNYYSVLLAGLSNTSFVPEQSMMLLENMISFTLNGISSKQ